MNFYVEPRTNMPRRHIAILSVLTLAFAAFVVHAVSDPNWSPGDVLRLLGFSLFFVVLVALLLITRGSRPVEGQNGLPRGYWVVFASLVVAFVCAMLLSVLVMPWLGVRGFEFVFAPENWWVLPVLAAVAFPFVRRRLL